MIDSIGFKTREEAEDFLKSIRDIIEMSSHITQSDIKKMVGFDEQEGDDVTGWDNLDEAGFVQSLNGYEIFLPKPNTIFSKAETNHLKVKNSDMISHPDHYQTEKGLEVIDVIEAFTADLKGIEATDTGNIIKYACRWSKKNGIQDLKKLIWYANHLINHIQETEKEN